MIWIVAIAVGAGLAMGIVPSIISRRAGAKNWSQLQSLVSGVVSKEGLSGIYKGRAVRGVVSGDSSKETMTFAGVRGATTSVVWKYELVMDAGVAGRGRDWNAAHSARQWQINAPEQVLAERLQAAGANALPELEKINLNSFSYDSRTGQLRGKSSITTGLASTFSQINQGGAADSHA